MRCNIHPNHNELTNLTVCSERHPPIWRSSIFFQSKIDNQTRTLALVSTYLPPDPTLLQESYKTIWATQYRGAEGLQVIEVTNILSVVAIGPLPSREGYFFVSEKLGLEIAALANMDDGDVDDNEPLT